MKGRFDFRPIRQKHWKWGSFFVLPALSITWDKDEEKPHTYIYLRWLSYQFAIYFE